MRKFFNLKTTATMFLIFVLLISAGCSNAEKAKWGTAGSSSHIKQFSGGQVIGEWDSDGWIENEVQSDGYYFKDRKTGRSVRLSGTVQITLN